MAIQFGLERIAGFMRLAGQDTRQTQIVFEARGAKEDQTLELSFRRLCDGGNYTGQRFPFSIVIADKRANSEGLQTADLMARPVGLSVLRPDQPNRAMEILEPKFARKNGSKMGIGLKVFP